MMKTHTQFFNTSNFFNTIITGIDLAIEEKEGFQAKDTISGLKAGLMGPFAAIGDSIFAALVPTILVHWLRIWPSMEIRSASLSGSLHKS